MFARASSLFVLALPVIATASVLPRNDPTSGPSNQCNTGSIQCCNSTQTSTAGPLGLLLGLLGIVVGDVTGLIGVTCSPITAIGVAGNSCSAQPVCCTNNSFNGIVALGCTPININL
ncbi:fungal hydrophobin-domain-containing protein [Flammula alnicola]|nr:fungal hydrophobin-domain-containing protein [Flammula alnicola]